MAFLRASRLKLVWALELSLGLELYACAVLALHARGLRATPLEASPALVLPALVIPPVFYVLVGLVIVRPLSPASVLGAAGAMCGLHALLVMGTGALFMIPDLLDYGAAVAFALWGSPAVTLLQLTAAPLVFARLRPLLSPPRSARESRAAQRRQEAPAIAAAPRLLMTPPADAPVAARPAIAPPAPSSQRGPIAPAPARPPLAPPVVAAPVAAPSVAPPPAVPAPAAGPAAWPFRAPAATGHAPAPTMSPSPTAAVEPPPVIADLPVVRVVTPADPVPVAVPSSEAKPSAPSRRALDWSEPMVRVSFGRIAEQLPVEMFARGAEGLKDAQRPGVSLLVPRKLLLPHLSEGIAPVKWEIVADQFPIDELALTDAQIAERLPDGSLLLPLDEVVPQIPATLLTLSTPPADVHAIEEFPAPFQPRAQSEDATAHAAEMPGPDLPDLDASQSSQAPRTPEALVQASETEAEPAPDVESESEFEPAHAAEARVQSELAAVPPEPELAVVKPEPELVAVEPEPELVAVEPEPELAAVEREPALIAVDAGTLAARAAALFELDSDQEAPSDLSESEPDSGKGRNEQARRIAATMGPLLNGLEIGQWDGDGATLLTLVVPTVDEDAVVRTAARVLPFLTDTRLPEPVTQATLIGAQATVVLTPMGSHHAGEILVAAVASRASLAWLERLSRTAARDTGARNGNGAHADPRRDPGGGIELSEASVPAAVRELATTLTAFGPVVPTLLRDAAGALSACLFLPSSLDARPLARLARDLQRALHGAEIGLVASVILKLGPHRLVLRPMDDASGEATMLIGAGRVDRPGLARIELDRAATRLATLVRS